MYITLKEIHNALGMMVLFALLLIILIVLIAFIRKKPFGKSTKIAALIGFIFIHLQLGFGFILYILSPLGIGNFSTESMGHAISRFYIIEHPLGMVLAATLITIGYRSAKKDHLSDAGKYKRILFYYILGFTIISYLIPWFLWN